MNKCISRRGSTTRWLAITNALVAFCLSSSLACGFVPQHPMVASRSRLSEHVDASSSIPRDVNDDINQHLERARALLEKTRAKLAAKELKQKESLPFYASKEVEPSSVNRDGIIKTRDEKTGLVVVDGEKMAAISEQEEWEVRSLYQVFQNEISENEDVYSLASQQLASRDLAASVWELRRSLKNDDYRKIFDTKNVFIGEDN